MTVWPLTVSLSLCCSVTVASESFAASWAVARQAPLSMGFPQAGILE